MISSEDKDWVCAIYPGLVPTANGVAGIIQFSATYDPAVNRFLILVPGVVDDVGGVKLSCSYQVRIADRERVVYSALPALHVEGLELVEDRHFSRIDNSACLCSPLQEDDFRQPAFDFRKYIQQLVMPFLYGQSFYSEFHRWPWAEYAHGATGLLESFSDENIMNETEIRKFLDALSLDRVAWPLIRTALEREEIKGHTPCFCPKRDNIRRCHPKALTGVRRLQQELKRYSLPVP